MQCGLDWILPIILKLNKYLLPQTHPPILFFSNINFLAANCAEPSSSAETGLFNFLINLFLSFFNSVSCDINQVSLLTNLCYCIISLLFCVIQFHSGLSQYLFIPPACRESRLASSLLIFYQNCFPLYQLGVDQTGNVQIMWQQLHLNHPPCQAYISCPPPQAWKYLYSSSRPPPHCHCPAHPPTADPPS